MSRLILAALAAALIAGCGAGQPLGPTLRSGCQQAKLDSEQVKKDLAAVVAQPVLTPEQQIRKDALKQCSRDMTETREACDAAPSEALAQAEQAQTAECKAMLLPSEVTK